MKNILITGAAGFIGMHTVLKFLEKGFNVIGIDNINNYYSEKLKLDRIKNIIDKSSNLKGKWTFQKLDISKKDDLNSLSSYKIYKVIHLAAQAGVRYSIKNPDIYVNSNIIGFKNIIDFCLKNKINNLIYASSSSVYGKSLSIPFHEDQQCQNPESFYAFTKISNELMASSFYNTKKLNSIGLRFFTVYGPWGRPDMAPMLFVKAAMEKNKINVFNYGNQSRDFTYIDDIVEGIFLVSKKFWSNKETKCEVMNIGKGSPVKLLDFIKTLETTLELNIKKNFVEAQIGDVELTYASTKKIYNYVNFMPKTDIKSGVISFVKWYLEYYKY